MRPGHSPKGSVQEPTWEDRPFWGEALNFQDVGNEAKARATIHLDNVTGGILQLPVTTVCRRGQYHSPMAKAALGMFQ